MNNLQHFTSLDSDVVSAHCVVRVVAWIQRRIYFSRGQSVQLIASYNENLQKLVLDVQIILMKSKMHKRVLLNGIM